MKRSRKRNRKIRNKEKQKEESFFSKANDTTSQPLQTKEEGSFFQAKSEGVAIGQPGDKYEQEADQTAQNVVNKKEGEPAQIQEKPISGIQRYMTNSKEDELGTNTMRIEKDKFIQEQVKEEEDLATMGQAKEEEDPAAMGQAKEEEDPAAMGQAKEEEDPATMGQAKEEEDPATMGQAKEEEDPAAMGQAKEEEDKRSSSHQHKNRAQDQRMSGPAVKQILDECKGKGQPLPKEFQLEMETKFGFSFEGVRIHTGKKAIQLNEMLHAQAFTYGMDIYFNAGKFNPESTEGKLLIAHELTHIIQQQGGHKSTS